MRASEADAVRPGVNEVAYNAGKIISTTTTGSSSSDGVDAQNNSGLEITNDTGGLIEGGRHGITWRRGRRHGERRSGATTAPASTLTVSTPTRS
jgi:hypothetical protein